MVINQLQEEKKPVDWLDKFSFRGNGNKCLYHFNEFLWKKIKLKELIYNKARCLWLLLPIQMECASNL